MIQYVIFHSQIRSQFKSDKNGLYKLAKYPKKFLRFEKIIRDIIRDKNLSIEWCELKDRQNDDNKIDEDVDPIKVELVDLAFNIYTLRWKKNIIYGDYRNYVKKLNQIEYKANILTCRYLEDVFYRNELQEINWKNTFNFIQKGTSSNKKFTDALDNALWSYKIKNLLKLLPTYMILFERDCGHVMTDLCPRYEIDVEDWEHVWSCNDNEKSEYDVLIKTLIVLEEKFKDSGDEERYKLLKRWPRK
ncbi:hypothetical protein RhiirA4_476926 [Rhizophagus irregularis]|uniref:Uncharacterized protein n=1 Tax=Rhizophagus irregularis TaxID=588596 RepID=A0A2I1HCD6_9GLOM|nr:hypothetical protein RhiirA4_476926 [Rhizophagus irregularis]